MKKWECQTCGYVYDPDEGDPDNRVEAGTSLENLPEDWICPECGVTKDEFEMLK
ncbi:MAG TPA: rubredoxin [Actinobacteria bacterium]|nr:rubredoxin [Actinomycetota bacterium]